MKIAISTDGACDLAKTQMDQLDLKIIYQRVFLGDKEYFANEVTSDMIFNYVKTSGNLPKTSGSNPFQYEEHFENILKEYDAIIHIGFSSGVSSSCNNAKQAATNFNGKVFVIDSLNLSSAIALIVIKARKLVDEGHEINQIVEELNNYVQIVHCSFIVENVDYLYKGGRCSKLAMLGANFLHIRPSINVINGKLEPSKKYRGKFEIAIYQFCDDTLSSYKNFDVETIYIGTSTAINDEIKNNVLEKFKAKGFKNIYFISLNTLICCYCGPETFGILFAAKD